IDTCGNVHRSGSMYRFVSIISLCCVSLVGCKDAGKYEEAIEGALESEAAADIDKSQARADAKLCDNGDPEGCERLAESLRAIRRVDPEAVDACFMHELYEKACKAERATACFGLA